MENTTSQQETYLVSLESPDAPSTLRSGVGVSTSGCNKLPHLDRLVQTTRDEILSVWREGNGVDGILVAVWSFETLDEVAGGGIPDPDALVKRSSGDILRVGRDRNGGNPILDTEGQDILTRFNIPEAHRTVATARCNGTAITSEVERVDILLVTGKGVPDGSGGNIPNLGTVSIRFDRSPTGGVTHPDQLILCTGCQESSIWTEAHASDVEIANRIHRLVLEDADLLSGNNVENLSRSVAARRNIFAIMAESDAADNTLVLEGVDQVNVKDARHARVEDGKPI